MPSKLQTVNNISVLRLLFTTLTYPPVNISSKILCLQICFTILKQTVNLILTCATCNLSFVRYDSPSVVERREHIPVTDVEERLLHATVTTQLTLNNGCTIYNKLSPSVPSLHTSIFVSQTLILLTGTIYQNNKQQACFAKFTHNKFQLSSNI